MTQDPPGRLPPRDPGFAPQTQAIVSGVDGGWTLENTTAYETPFPTSFAPIFHWAKHAPARTWMAQRLGAGWREVSYGEAAASLPRLASGLSDLGVGPDGALLILARNGINHALLTYAAHMVGAAVASLSPQYAMPGADPSRLQGAVKIIRPKALYVDDAAAMASVISQMQGLGQAHLLTATGSSYGLSVDRLERNPSGEPAAPALDAPALIMMTSGSTGRPKAVVCTQATIAANVAQVAACFKDWSPPVVVNSAPWSHALGALSVRQMVLHRGGALYVDHGQPTPTRFGETVTNLLEISPTYHHFVPAGWALMADALEQSDALAQTFFKRLQVMQYGGANLPQAVVDRIEAAAVRTIGRGVSLITSFGCTETGPVICNIHWPNTRSGLIGLPVPGTTIKLAPAAGGKLEVRVKGPQISPGYLTEDGLTPLPLDAEGYYALGDAGCLVKDGARTILAFDGRLVENFKLASGTFVSAGSLRVAAVSALDGLAADCVVCGEGEAGVGLLIFLNAAFCRTKFGDLRISQLSENFGVRQAVLNGLNALNAAAIGGSSRIARAMILDEEPDPASGEIAEKGYLNQALCRARRQDKIARLFHPAPDADVLIIGEAT